MFWWDDLHFGPFTRACSVMLSHDSLPIINPSTISNFGFVEVFLFGFIMVLDGDGIVLLGKRLQFLHIFFSIICGNFLASKNRVLIFAFMQFVIKLVLYLI